MELTHPTKKLGLPQKCAIALLIFAFNLTGTANALPGQPIKRELQWAQNHPILPKLTEDGYGRYNGITSFEGGQLEFTISPSDGPVEKEWLLYRHDNQYLVFTKTEPEALRLLERIYDRTIADDFRNSQYVTQVGSNKFYKGRKFAYIADTEEPGGLTLTRLENLAGEIKCQQTNPDCGEL